MFQLPDSLRRRLRRIPRHLFGTPLTGPVGRPAWPPFDPPRMGPIAGPLAVAAVVPVLAAFLRVGRREP